MATAKPTLKTRSLTTQAIKPVFAYVGATDLAVEKVRVAVADVSKRVAVVQKTDAKKIRAAIETRVSELQGEALGYPAKVQSLVDENVTAATAAYTDLIKRGESLVGRIRRQQSTKATAKAADTTVAKAKTTVTQAKEAVDATVDAADKTAATKVAPKPTTKPAARKAAAKKASATTARKKAAKKTATAQSSAKATATAATNTAASAPKAGPAAAAKIAD